MADDGTPPDPPRFPPPDDDRRPARDGLPPPVPPGWPPPDAPGYPTNQYGYAGGSGHWLHPLDIGRAFSAGWRLFRFNWRAMVGALAVVLVPISILEGIYDGYIAGPALAAWNDAYQAALITGNFANLPPPPPQYWISLLLSLVFAVFGVIATAAVVHQIAGAYGGARESAVAGLRAGFARVGTLIGAVILIVLALVGVALVALLSAVVAFILGYAIGSSGLGVFLGLIAAVGMVAALIFFGLRWSLFVQAVMIDGVGAKAALGRSWRLVAGSTWRVLGYFLLLYLVLFLIGLIWGFVLLIVVVIVHPGVITATFTDPSSVFILTIGGTLISLLVSPWWLSVMTLLYYDLRWRQGQLRSATPPAST